MDKENRLLQILAYIYSQQKPVNAHCIALHLGLPISTVYRILKQLKETFFIAESLENGFFTAGLATYHAQTLFEQHAFIASQFHPFLKDLVSQTQEMAAIIVATDHHTLCIDQVESTQTLRCSFAQGSQASLIKGASAKTLLAFSHPTWQTRIIQRFVPQKIDQEKLKVELQIIYHQGYGITCSEIDPDVWGCSFPLLKKGKLMAVITTMSPAFRAMTKQNQLIDLTQKTAHEIQEFLMDSYSHI